LAGQHKTLVGGQFVGELAQASDLVAIREAGGYIGHRIDDGADW
jgi:hypothetical protein